MLVSGVLSAAAFNRVVNSIHLRYAESDHSESFLRILLEVLKNQVGNDLCLFQVVPFAATVIDAAWNMNQLYA